MDSESRGFVLTLVYDMLIFIGCFTGWLYLRVVRGDPTYTSSNIDVTQQLQQQQQQQDHAPEVSDISTNPLFPDGGPISHPLLSDASAFDTTQESNSSRSLGYRIGNWINAFVDGVIHLFCCHHRPGSSAHLTKDTRLYLEFLKASTRLFLCLTAIGCAIVLPLNLSAPSNNPLQSFFDRAAAENVVSHSVGIWLLYVVCWLYSVIGYYFIYIYWKKTLRSGSFPQARDMVSGAAYSRRFSISSIHDARPEDFTLMITGLPRECSFRDGLSVDLNSSDLAIEMRRHFETLYPGQVVASEVILNYSALTPTQKELIRARAHLEKLDREINDTDVLRAASAVDIRATDYSPEYDHAIAEASSSKSLVAASVDAEVEAAYWRDRCDSQNTELLRDISHQRFQTAGVAFVTFSCRQAVEECLSDPRVVGFHYDWNILPAPPPQDIVWENIHISSEDRLIRKIVLNILLIILSFAVVSPVSVVSSNMSPFSYDVSKATTPLSFFKLTFLTWVPSLILLAINNLLVPTLVSWAALGTRYWRRSSQTSYILNGNIVYLILYTLVIPLMSLQSLSALITAIYKTEIQKWSINLGFLLLSSSGSFAIRYLVNSCFITSSLQLLQLPQLSAKGIIRTGILGIKTNIKWVFDFGYWYAVALSVFTLVLVFSVVVPLVLPFGALFFAMMYRIDRYNFENHIWSVDPDSGGEVASLACRYMLFAISFLQFCMAGFFLIQNDKYLTLAGTLLFIISTVSWVLLLCHSDGILGVTSNNKRTQESQHIVYPSQLDVNSPPPQSTNF